ncbi:hypothetical protein A0256_06480 [Mucilaginibacter sp. PAMC 26640]|nr:hypothetical protein A0256_06480 [Mucilaginibacter sp. PAMC 26640]
MIEVFKTNVDDVGRSRMLIRLIYERFTVSKVNFDLEDCDNVLRIEGREFCAGSIIEFLKANGHCCEVLI